MLLGERCHERVLCYDANSGWLGYTLDELTENTKRSVDAGALGIVQPSDMKLGGLSRWLEAAALARAADKRVVPAGWNMLQIDQHLAAATPHCWMVESIPWIRDILREPARLEDGYLIVPDARASTAIKPELLDRYAISQ